jgi:hypothetical protein
MKASLWYTTEENHTQVWRTFGSGVFVGIPLKDSFRQLTEKQGTTESDRDWWLQKGVS